MSEQQDSQIAALAKKRAEAIKRQREKREENQKAEAARLSALRKADRTADQEKFGRLVEFLAALSQSDERYISIADICADLGYTKAEVSGFCKSRLGLAVHHADRSLLVIPREPRRLQLVRKGPFVTRWVPVSAQWIWTELWEAKWTEPDDI